jgi:hypothetical protein
MGNYRWILGSFTSMGWERAEAIELGAGDGTLGRFVRARHPGVELTGYDLRERPADWPENFGWLQGDVRETLRAGAARGKVVIANMVLHHFEDEDLRTLGGLLAECRGILASEPWRHRTFARMGSLLRAIGLSADTWHDLRVSVRGGFRGQELPALLGCFQSLGRVRVFRTGLGSYRMAAQAQEGGT